MSAITTCSYDWCATDHGHVHPDDDAHFSSGVAVQIYIRNPQDVASIDRTEVDVGLARRLDDNETWLSIDNGTTVCWEISLASLRAALSALDADPVALDAMRL